MAKGIGRRLFLSAIGGATVACPLAAHAQQPVLPVIGFVSTGSADGSAPRATAFRKDLSETGYVEGQHVMVEYHWLEGRNDLLPAVMADLVRRQVAVIATPASIVASLAAKAATATIPIVFAAPEDPVRLVLSPAWPAPAATRPASILSPRR
jgi:putative ABC transport system substrate-binding protein